MDKTYLGDGVYAFFDGNVWISLGAGGKPIALHPKVMIKLIDFFSERNETFSMEVFSRYQPSAF